MENNVGINTVKSGGSNKLLYVIIIILLLVCVGGGVYFFTELNAKNDKIEDLKEELEECENGDSIEIDVDEDNDIVAKKQTISCTSDVPVDLGNMSASVDFVYDGKSGTLTSGVMKMIYAYDISAYSDSQKEVFDQSMISSLGTMCDTFDDEGYAGCNVTGSNGEYKMIINFDMENLGLATEDGITKTTKPEEVLKYFEQEEQGFTCSIK